MGSAQKISRESREYPAGRRYEVIATMRRRRGSAKGGPGPFWLPIWFHRSGTRDPPSSHSGCLELLCRAAHVDPLPTSAESTVTMATYGYPSKLFKKLNKNDFKDKNIAICASSVDPGAPLPRSLAAAPNLAPPPPVRAARQGTVLLVNESEKFTACRYIHRSLLLSPRPPAAPTTEPTGRRARARGATRRRLCMA